jgi:hypothetical protein
MNDLIIIRMLNKITGPAFLGALVIFAVALAFGVSATPHTKPKTDILTEMCIDVLRSGATRSNNDQVRS